MTQVTELLLNLALQLSPSERELLAEQLLYLSLDTSPETEDEVGAAWRMLYFSALRWLLTPLRGSEASFNKSAAITGPSRADDICNSPCRPIHCAA
jgi:hypothetical protein